MKKKIMLLGMVVVIILFCGYRDKSDCSLIKHREQYLNHLTNLNDVHIVYETMVDDYIISGYTSSNGNYGIAIFEPVYQENYKFQSNINSNGSEILFSTVIINDVFYDLFWANKADLDFAKITYRINSETKEYRMDAANNKILYLQAPAKNYDVSITFVADDGYCYE